MKKRNQLFKIFTPLIIFVLFTVTVVTFDVAKIGPNQSEVGYSTINLFMKDLIGVNMLFYEITDWLGITSLIIGIIYGVIGFLQLMKMRSFKKVNHNILRLGGFYIFIIATYVFFESVIVNYRPILIDGYLEASYPSTHVFVSITVLYSSIMVNRSFLQSKRVKLPIEILLYAIMTIILLGRILSGVHWFTDIIAGILLSYAMLVLFSQTIKKTT